MNKNAEKKIKKVIKMFKKNRHNEINIVFNADDKVYDIEVNTSYGKLQLGLDEKTFNALSVFEMFCQINAYYDGFIGLCRLQKEKPDDFNEIMKMYEEK